MKVGDLVALKHSPWLTLGIVVKLGGDEDGPGWFMSRHLKLWTDTDIKCPG